MSQQPPKASNQKKPILKRKSVIIALIGAAASILAAIITGIFVLLAANRGVTSSSTPTPMPILTPTSSLSTPQPKTPTFIPTCAKVGSSSLIPSTPPVFCDPLSNPSNPTQWQTGKQGSVTCTFLAGVYQLTAPANTPGGGCAVQSPNATFTNFVYQIKVTMRQGMGQNGGTAGVAFCVSDALQGSLYGVNFNAQGYWNFGILTGGNSQNTMYNIITQNTSMFFLTGIGQTNYITVMVKNHHIDAQINGHLLFSIIDTTLNEGTIGVGLTPGKENADVAFSDAIVWLV